MSGSSLNGLRSGSSSSRSRRSAWSSTALAKCSITLDFSPIRAAIRARLKYVLERFERSLQVPCMEQVIPEAVPALRVVGIRVAQQAIDPRGLGVVSFRTQARRREGARVSVHLALPLQERPEKGKSLLPAALLEQFVRPHEARGRRRHGRGCGGSLLRRALTSLAPRGTRPPGP